MQRGDHVARAFERSERGFTVIELMMVVLIIAILIAFLLPTYFGATKRANDRAMQSSLRNAIVAAKEVYVDKQDYTLANAAALNGEGVPLKFVNETSDPHGQNTVSVDRTISASYIVFGGESKSGTCFYVSDNALGDGTLYASLPGGGGCHAAGAPLPGDAAWTGSW